MIFQFPDPLATASLTVEEIARAIALLCNSTVPTSLKEAFLTALNHRGEKAAEMAGFAGELLKQSVKPEIERDDAHPMVELCGTGGDNAGLINISTAAMFVVAGAGVRVIKHGNRAVSSRCGSADVLEALGVGLHLKPESVSEIMELAGCVFLLASDFHPLVAQLTPIRRSLAVRGQLTIFNLLGPLLNPAMPEYQLTGVYQRKQLVQYASAMGLLGRRKAWAVCGTPPAGMEGGIDELTVTGRSIIVEYDAGSIQEFAINPDDLGFPLAASYNDLTGGDAVENANRIVGILSGRERSAAREMIALNAGAALHIVGKAATLIEGVDLAKESIDSGKSLVALEKLKRASGLHSLS